MLVNLFQQLKRSLVIDTPKRDQEKSFFIESRVANLQNLDLTDNEFNDKVNGYLRYNKQGVFNALAFNSSVDSESRPKIISQIISNSGLLNLSIEELYYSNMRHNGIKAYFNEEQHPKIAIICIGNNVNSVKVLPFVDRDELKQILKTSALEDSFQQFNEQQLDAEQLINNVIKMSSTKDEAFKRILTGVNNEISPIEFELTKQFDIATQLDKSLKLDNNNITEYELAMLRHLNTTGKIETYQKSRINRHSVLPDKAQQKLMLALDQLHTKNPKMNQQFINEQQSTSISHQNTTNNQILSVNGIRINELAKEHETLFTKTESGGSYYWENTEKTVTIHPEKISVPKVSKDSVELALSAATSNFGKTISIRGTEEFVGHVLQILSTNEKFSDVNLSNESLQNKLNEMRGVKILTNEITAPPPENLITSSTPEVDNTNISPHVEDSDTAISKLENNHNDNIENCIPSDDSIKQIDNTQLNTQAPLLQANINDSSPALTTGNPDDLTAMIVERDTFAGLTTKHFIEALKYYDVNQKDTCGQTALITAAMYCMPEEARALINSGANVNIIDTDSRASALSFALIAPSNRMELSELLLQNSADVNLVPNTRISPLMSVIISEDKFKDSVIEPLNDAQRASLINQMLKCNADPDFQDYKGRTALHFAVEEDRVDIVKSLLEHGANPMLVDYGGNTSLHYIHPSAQNAEQIAELLVNNGNDPYILNQAGEMAQFTQACKVSEEIITQDHQFNSSGRSR